jgi:ribosomal protein S18 acetylase RimI-like enzyme
VTLTLRAAVAEDVDRLVTIARRAWLSAFAEHAPGTLIAWWRAADREPAWYARYWPDMIVAEQAGSLVGLAQPAADEVNGLWIDPGWQGRGVGRRLLQAAESRIEAMGYGRAWLTCSGFNRRAAGFYRACGYRLEREVVQTHPSGVAETVWTFARQLGTPAT